MTDSVAPSPFSAGGVLLRLPKSGIRAEVTAVATRGILFVLHTGIQWEYLPQELGFGSGMTCWRRLAAWNEAGVWDQLHAVLLKKLRSKNQLDWSRAVIDSSHVRAARRGPKAGPARSTAHVRAASTTSSSTARASRSRCP